MYQLEDRILFDGAAVVDAAAAQQALNDQQAEAQQAQEAKQAEDKNSADDQNSQHQDQHHQSDSGAQTGADATADSADAHDAALGLDTDDVQDFLSNSLSDSVADDTLKVYIAASDSLQLDALRDAANDHTIVIEYDAATTTKADLMRMLSETLNGRKADSITFVDADGDADAGDNAGTPQDSTAVADPDTDDDLATDFSADEFAGQVTGLVADPADVHYLDATDADDMAQLTADLDADHDAAHDDLTHHDDDGDDVATVDDADHDDVNHDTTTPDHDVIDDYAAQLDVLTDAPVERHEIVFIDSKVQDIDKIVAAIDPSAEIVYLSGSDTIDQISDYLAQYDGNVDAIHFITHGAQGMVRIGDQDVNLDYLTANRETFANWGKALTTHGDIMFYGCNIANGAEGQALVNAIAAITGADVAATSRAAGGAHGNWDLEYQVGVIDTTNVTVDGYDAFLASSYNFTANADGDWSAIEWTLNGNTDDKYTWSQIESILTDSSKDTVTLTIGKKVTSDIGAELYDYYVNPSPSAQDNIVVEVVKDGVLTVDSSGFAFYGGTSANNALKIDDGGVLAVASGGTFKIGGADTSYNALIGVGSITIADGGEMQVVSGNLLINGSINPSSKPEKEGDPVPPSNMFTPTGKLTQTGGELHFRGAEIATVVNSTGGTFYYDGESAQAMAGGGSIYTDIVISGGAKTLWGIARVEGHLTLSGSTDVYLSAYDPNSAHDQLSGTLWFGEDATVTSGTGAFISDYDITKEYLDKDGKGTGVFYTISMLPGYLAFDLRKGNDPIRVSIGTDLASSDNAAARYRNYTTLLLANTADSGADLLSITLGGYWNASNKPYGTDDPGYTKMDFSISGLSGTGGKLQFNVIGYSRGAVSDNFTYAMASIYNGSTKLGEQFLTDLTANGTYHFQSKAVDGSALLVTSNLDGITAGVGSLRVAIDYANRFGGEITFSEAMKHETIKLDGMDLVVSSAIKITGWSGKNIITIDAQGRSGIFSVADTGSLTITNMNLVNGYSAGSGGTIYNAGILDMTNVTIENSQANRGGAIYADTDSVTKLLNVTLNYNRAVLDGGAVYVAGGALVSGNRVKVVGNQGSVRNDYASWSQNAVRGGAFFVAGGEGSLDKDGNPVVANQGGSLQLKNTTISNQKALQGAAIYSGDATLDYEATEKGTDAEGKEVDVKVQRTMHISGAVMLDAVTIDSNVATAVVDDAGTTYYNGAAVYTEGKVYGVNVTSAYNVGYGFMVASTGALTLESTTIAYNGFDVVDPAPGAVVRDADNVGIIREEGGYIRLLYALDTDNESQSDSYGDWFADDSIFSNNIYGFLPFTGKNADFLLQDNGGWVYTLALSTSITYGGLNEGETNLDARGFIYNSAIYDFTGRKVTVWRSVGSYQYNAAVVWNANNGNYYMDIQSAVNAAKAGEELHLAKTKITDEFFQYHASAQQETGSEILISRDLILIGEGVGETVLDARGNTRIFNIDNSKEALRTLVRIGGMTLTGGSADLGGAIYNRENLVLVQVDLIDNYATDKGGALYSMGGYVIAERVNFELNSAGNQGGAIYSASSSMFNANIVMDHSTLWNNAATDGGAIYQVSYGNYTAGLVLENTLLAYNIADGGVGGAVYAQGIVEMVNTTAAYNTASDGSALRFVFVNGNGKWSLTNVTVAWNQTAAGGATTGALAADGGTLALVNSLVAMNNLTYNATTGAVSAAGDIWNLDAQGNKIYAVDGAGKKINSVKFKHTNSVFQFRVQQLLNTSNPQNTAWQYDPTNRVVNSEAQGGDALFSFQAFMADTNGDYAWYGKLEDLGGWSRSLGIAATHSETVILGGKEYSVTHTSKLVNQGTNSGAMEYDQRGYLVNGMRDIGAFEYRGFIGTATYYDPALGQNVTVGITSLNEISGFGSNLLSGNQSTDYYAEEGSGAKDETAAAGMAYKDITVTLANTRVIDYNVQLNTMWAEYSDSTVIGGQRTVTIQGAAEGGSVLDANRLGSLLTVWGGYFWPSGATDPTWVMGTVSLERLTVTGAVGDYASAIHSKEDFTPAGGSINLTDVTLTDNISRLGGGGIYGRVSADDAAMKEVSYTITRSLIAYNLTAGSGGGIYTATGVTVTDSTIAYNYAGGNGGAIAVMKGGTLSVSGSTLAYNHATGEGGGAGIYNLGVISGVSGSIIAKNRTANPFLYYADYDGNPSSLRTGVYGNYLGDYDYVWGHKEATLPGAGTYNVVEIQNGQYYSGEGGNTNFFAPRTSSDPGYYWSTTGSLLGFSDGLFQNGYLSDNGGWSHTMALGVKSLALDWTTFTSGSDQRGYDYASGNIDQEYRDAGAFELNGAFITLVDAAGTTLRFNDFTKAVNAATSGSTLSVKAVRVKAYDVEITKSVTIKLVDGAGKGSFPLTRGQHTYIDAGYNGRVFSITNSAASVTLDGLYLYNGVSLIASAEAPTSAAGNGGLVYNTGTLTLNNVIAANGFAQQFGGAVFSSKALTITSDGSYSLLPASFVGNRALLGGAVYARGRLTVTGAKANMLGFSIPGILSGDGGGSLDLEGTVNFNQGSVQFINNVADDGAAMFVADLTATGNVTGVYFSGNQAGNQGGAVYASRNLGINFTDTLFYDNMSLSDGGAIYISGGSLRIDDSVLYTNTAFQSGGSLYAVGVDTITIYAGVKSSSGTVFNQNLAIYGNGGAVYADNFNTISIYGDLLLAEVGFLGNETIFGSGGAIYAQNGSALVIGAKASAQNVVVFDANLAGTDSRNSYYLGATNENGVSSGAVNNMMNQYANGGAIYGYNINAVTMFTNITLVENAAFTYGGALYLERVKSYATGRNVQFLYNLAGHSGGTVWSGVFDVTGDINKPQANGAGGAAYLVNVADINLDYTMIAGNYSGFHSWEKFFYYSSLSWLDANKATRVSYMDGGGFYIVSQTAQEPAPVITMNDLDVYDNNRVLANSADGGVVVSGIRYNGTINIFDQTFTVEEILSQSIYIPLAPVRQGRGGAFYIESPNAVLVVTNSGFDNNEAADGGAIYIAKQTKTAGSTQTVNDLTMKSASFTNVSFGSNRGTALRIEGLTDSLTLNYTTFAYNTLSSNGTTGLYFGGFASADAAAKFKLTLTNNIFYETSGKPVELTLPTDDSLTIVSMQNMFYHYDQFVINGAATMNGSSFTAEGLMLLTGAADRGDLGSIWAYQTDAKTGKAKGYKELAHLLDGAGNIVGSSTTTNDAISSNLYLSTEMAYHANYLTRAMALESKNSIAYHYALKNGSAYVEVRPGGAIDDTFNIGTDQRGNVRTGIQLIPVVAEDGTVTYTYMFYLYDANEAQWYEVVVADGQEPVKTAVAKEDVATKIRTSLGAFEPNFYMAVTSNQDNLTNGFDFIKNGNEEWHDIATALTGLTAGGVQFTDGGITLREALYWMDNYTLGGTANSAGEFVFDPSRYVRFSDSMFTDGKNTIELKSGQITIKQDVVVGMVDNYEGYRFQADNTFRAQNDLSRITISGMDQSRIFYIDYSEDFTAQMMEVLSSYQLGMVRYVLNEQNALITNHINLFGDSWIDALLPNLVTKPSTNGETPYNVPMVGGLTHRAQVGLNNLTITNGHQGYNTVTSASGSIMIGGEDAGRGGAVFNEGRLVMHNTVVKNSLATNADFGSNHNYGSYAGWGGGIFNDRKLSYYSDTIMTPLLKVGDSISASSSMSTMVSQITSYYLVSNGELYMYDSTVTGNRAQGVHLNPTTDFGGVGGGIANTGDAYIVRSAIDNNVAEGFRYGDGDSGRISGLGGGIFNGSYTYNSGLAVFSGSLNMYSSTVTANRLDYNSIGGGSYVYGGGGSAVHVAGGKAVLVGNTIAYNEAYRYVDGMGYAVVFNNEMRNGATDYILANNIIANNYVPGITPLVGRDLLFIPLSNAASNAGNIVASYGGNNIVGSVFGYADYSYYFGDQLGNNTLGNQSNGYVDKLYLSTEFKYNGGMTRNLRLGANSIAYTLNNVDKQVDIYDFAALDVVDPVYGLVYSSAFGDQRDLTAWGYDSNGVEVYRNPSPAGSKWIYADGTACTGSVTQVQARNTIGAYEMLTYVVSDTSVADQPLTGGDITYDYSYVNRETGYAGRNGWDVNLRQALYLADNGATVIFRVAKQLEAVTEPVLDDDGNPVYLTDADGNYILDADGNRIPKTQPVYLDGVFDEFGNPVQEYAQATDADGNPLYYDLFELKYGELNIFNSLTFQVKSTDGHGLTIDALNLSRAFNVDGTNFEVPNPLPLQVTIMGDDLPVNPDDVSVALTVINTAANGTGDLEQRGGAIFANGDLALINIDFRNSQAKSDGGAVYVANGNLTLNTVNFNRAADPNDPDFDAGTMSAGGNGGAVYVEGAALFTNVNIYNTTAAGDGGAVYVANALTASAFINVMITGATASNGNGGALYFYGGDLTLENVYIADSKAVASTDSSYGLGGAVYVNSSGNVIFGNETTGVGVTMVGNSAVAGGAVYIANAKLISISQGSFVNNTATGYPGAYGHGGGIYIVGADGMSIRVINTTIANNTAVGNGGGIYIGNGEVIMQSVTIANNIAGYGQPVHVPSDNAFGGGVYMNAGTLTVDNSVIAQNFVNTDLAIADAIKPGRATRNDIHMNLNRADYDTVSYSVIGTMTGTVLPASSVDTHSYRMGDGSGQTKWDLLNLSTSVLKLSDIDGMAGTIPTFIVYVYDGVGAVGGNPALTTSRDQLGRIRDVDPDKITMGAYQRITVVYELRDEFIIEGPYVNVGANWIYYDKQGGMHRGTDGIFQLPDAVFTMYATDVTILDNGSAAYNGVWTIGPLGQVKMMDGSMFSITDDMSMSGRMSVENGAYFFIDVKETNIAGLVFMVAEKSTVHYGQATDLLRSMEYGNLILDADGIHSMNFDGTNLVVRGTFTVNGLGASDNALDLSGTDPIVVEVRNLADQDPAMTVANATFNLAGSLDVSGNIKLDNGIIVAIGDISADTIDGVNGVLSSYGDISFLSVYGTNVTALGSITIGDGVHPSAVNESTLYAGTDIAILNDVAFYDATASAVQSISIAGDTWVASRFEMIAGTTATFGGDFSASVTAAKVTADTLIFQGSVTAAYGTVTLTGVSGLSFDGYTDRVTVGADAYLTFALESAAGVINVVGEDGVTGDPLFDVRNISVDLGGRLDFVTGGQLLLGNIPDGAADNIYGTLGLFSSNTITVGAAGSELIFNNATVIFGSDVLIAGPLISIDHGVQFLGNVTVADGIGAVTVEAQLGSVVFGKELVGNGDNFTITGMDVRVGTIRNVGDLIITATDASGAGTITLGGPVTVLGDIVLSSHNPILVTGDAGLSGQTLTTDAAFQGIGNLTLNFSDTATVSNILGVQLGGTLTLVQGNYVIAGVMTVGGLVTGSNAAATVKVDMTVNGNVNNAGNLTAEKKVGVSGNLVNSGVFNAASTVDVGGNLVNSGSFTAQDVVTIGGDLENTGTFVAVKGVILNGSLTTKGSFTVKDDLKINGNIINEGDFLAEKSVTAGGSVTSIGTFKVIGALEVGGDLSSKGTFEADDTVNVIGGVTNEGDFTALGLVTIGGDLSTEGTFAAGGSVEVGGGVVNSGTFQVDDHLTVGKDMFSDGDVLVVNGLTQIGGRLTTFGSWDSWQLEVGNGWKAQGTTMVRDGVHVTGDLVSDGSFKSVVGSVVVLGNLSTSGSFSAAEMMVRDNAVLDGTCTIQGKLAILGSLQNFATLEVGSGLWVIQDLSSAGTMTVAGWVSVGGDLTNYGAWTNGDMLEVGGSILNYGNFMTDGDATLGGNLTNYDSFRITGTLTLNGTVNQLLNGEAGVTQVGALTLNNAAGATLVGRTELAVDGAFTFGDAAFPGVSAGAMNIGNGRLTIGGAIVGNTDMAYFMLGDQGRVYLNLTAAQLPGNGIWIGNAVHVGRVFMTSTHLNHVVGLGTYSPMTTTGQPGGEALRDPSQAYDRSITIDSGDLDLRIDLSQAYDASEKQAVKNPALFGYSNNRWTQLKPVGKSTAYNVSGDATYTYAVSGFNFAGVNDPPIGYSNLYQRELRDQQFVSAQIQEPERNQYLLSLANMRFQWSSHAETDPLNTRLAESGSALAAPVRLGLLGGRTVYGSPIDDTLLEDGVTLRPLESHRIVTVEEDAANDRANWMEVFASLAERDEIQERHPAFQDNVDRAIAAFLSA